MPNKNTHIAVGMAVGLAATLYYTRNLEPRHRTVEVIGGVVGGYIGGRMPDVLDPPLSPLHRSYAHGGLAIAGLVQWQLDQVREHCRAQAADCARRGDSFELLFHFWAGLLTGFKAGYASHLALDCCTPASLPLLGR